jgi:hypothetical protein
MSNWLSIAIATIAVVAVVVIAYAALRGLW